MHAPAADVTMTSAEIGQPSKGASRERDAPTATLKLEFARLCAGFAVAICAAVALTLNGHEPWWKRVSGIANGQGAAWPRTWPSPGHKLQLNATSFSVNDFECLELLVDHRRLWASERVHCELRRDGDYDWVVEHFDDPNCTRPNHQNPGVRHRAVGCFFYSAFNNSFNDACQPDRTVTISAFFGAGCVYPMPITATNLEPQGGARRARWSSAAR